MPSLVPVPERYRAGMRALASADDEQFSKLVRLLDQQENLLFPRDLRSKIEVTQGLPPDSSAILSTVFAMNYTAVDAENSPQELDELSRDPELEIAQSEQDAFVRRIKLLLGSPAIRGAAKAANLLTDHDHVYLDARVLTDIRPVFTDDPESPPTFSAGVVVSNLKIDHYGPSGDLTSFHVALDHLDLVELKGVVDRALKKVEASKKFLAEHGVKYLEERQ